MVGDGRVSFKYRSETWCEIVLDYEKSTRIERFDEEAASRTLLRQKLFVLMPLSKRPFAGIASGT